MMRSLAGRFFVLSALWIGIALIGAWLVIGGGLDRFVTERFRAEIQATSDAIVAALEARPDGTGAELGVPILDPRYERPLSGWYWQVTGPGGPSISSDSLFRETLRPPFDVGPDGQGLFAITREVTIPDVANALTVVVTAPDAELAATRRAIRGPLFWSLAALGAGLATLAFLQGRLALGGFAHIRRGIGAIRDGTAGRVPRRGLSEIDAPIDEINALLEANRATLTRTREHVGNLAHALKTPLAALVNGTPQGSEEAAIARRMDRLIGYHLRRARGAGSAHLLGARTSVVDVAEDIVTVLRGAARERHVSMGVDCPEELYFAGDREDLEEILGNIVENAVAWAHGRVDIAARAEGSTLVLSVSDDGPGIPEESHAHVLARGARLDETTSGTGLGLGIVADLVALNDGKLAFTRSPDEGLSVFVRLPLAGTATPLRLANAAG
ncbi:Signal transduction histidine kinase [Roseivivax marinus]|uniref:sensor histidine kinase n=1 Tax=Roseivivax marinus TaxID=1379903 RepID=UPI0008C1751D|nr:HAMP domain-containing sensor histidine kinase [Roseivivax marinus]SEL93038.1 Signal transduction histidine kinase [Roseivivax marinus]